MLSPFKSSLAVAAVALAASFAPLPSEAASPRCRPDVTAGAERLGVLGVGSARAREAARIRWSERVADRYGSRYANFRNADDVSWRCRPGLINPARCRVTARPCRY